MNEELNKGFDYPVGQIEEVIGAKINEDFGSDYNRIVPLRSLKEVKGIILFGKELFYRLIRKIPLRNECVIYPYAEAEINIFRRQPEGFHIGQTFIHAKKILSLMENLESRLFASFSNTGLSKMPASKVYGIDQERKKAIAFYIPPIAEVYSDNRNGNSVALIDGVHRSYISRAAGTTINTIHINYVSLDAPLPFDPIHWENAKLVEEKPPIKERYVNFRREYFRDLSAMGIDG